MDTPNPLRTKTQSSKIKIKNRSLVIAITLFVWLSCPNGIILGHKNNSYAGIQETWPLFTVAGKPLRMALNETRSERPDIREIFIFMEDRYFTTDNLQEIFLELAKENEWPKELRITVFSDKSMLLRAIDNFQSTVCISFIDSPEGKEAKRKFYERFYPLKSGYFRAFYFRHRNGDQMFQYSPDQNKEEMVKVSLSKPA
jgi:hypothetical protein